MADRNSLPGRQLAESECNAAPDSAANAEILAGLAADMGVDFAESGVVMFAQIGAGRADSACGTRREPPVLSELISRHL
jgi:hypothetical protein